AWRGGSMPRPAWSEIAPGYPEALPRDLLVTVRLDEGVDIGKGRQKAFLRGLEPRHRAEPSGEMVAVVGFHVPERRMGERLAHLGQEALILVRRQRDAIGGAGRVFAIAAARQELARHGYDGAAVKTEDAAG